MSSLKTLQQLQPQVFDRIQVEIPSSEAVQIQTRHNETPITIYGVVPYQYHDVLVAPKDEFGSPNLLHCNRTIY